MRRKWTKEEVAILEKHYLILPYKDIAKKLGRETSSIAMKVSNLELRRKYQIEYAVYDGERYLFSGNAKECMDRLKINNDSFRCFVSRQGKFEGGIQIINIGRWEIEE